MQISTDTIDTDTNYRHKTDYYNKPEILSYSKQFTGANRLKFLLLELAWHTLIHNV